MSKKSKSAAQRSGRSLDSGIQRRPNASVPELPLPRAALEERFVKIFRRLRQADQAYSKRLEKEHGVTRAQLACILALNAQGSLTGKELALHLAVGSGTATGIVDRLIEKGLAERERCAGDRRVITVRLTPAGKDFAAHAAVPVPPEWLEAMRKAPIKGVRALVNGLALLDNTIAASTASSNSGTKAGLRAAQGVIDKPLEQVM